MRVHCVISLILILFLSVSIALGQDDNSANELPRKFVASGELTDEGIFGIYTVRTYRTQDGDGSFETGADWI